MFLNGARGHFLCIHHGALFEPATGRCVRGPCDGDALRRLKVVPDADGLWVEE
jgi:nitrite reductase/ring-hydroxylating ferredoxin subunit